MNHKDSACNVSTGMLGLAVGKPHWLGMQAPCLVLPTCAEKFAHL